MPISASTHRWNCGRCGDYGLIELSPVIQSPAFDSYEWVKQFSAKLDRRAFRGREYVCLFDCGIPPEVLDELSLFRYETWTEAMKALRRAAQSAWAKGWKPCG